MIAKQLEGVTMIPVTDPWLVPPSPLLLSPPIYAYTAQVVTYRTFGRRPVATNRASNMYVCSMPSSCTTTWMHPPTSHADTYCCTLLRTAAKKTAGSEHERQ